MIRSEKTRQYIIEKTASIFNKKGFAGTYLSDLTEATGLSKGSIYGNFKDKNEVAIEAFKYNYGQLTDSVNLEMQHVSSAGDKLMVFLNFYKTQYSRVFETGGCAILNTATDSDDGNKPLKTEVTKAMNSWKNRIEQIVKDGIENGELKSINPFAYAVKFIALIEGSILMAKTLNQPEILMLNIDTLIKEIEELRR